MKRITNKEEENYLRGQDLLHRVDIDLARYGNGIEPLPFLEDRLYPLFNLKDMQIDQTENLVGNRWLERGQGGIILAPSGQGKSGIVVQSAVCWSCGRDAFHIKCKMPLRSIIVQHEDSKNDMIEEARIINKLQLTKEEAENCRNNLMIVRCRGKTGKDFEKQLHQYLNAFPCDLVFINHLSAYIGGSLYDDNDLKTFLYDQIGTTLTKHGAGGIMVSHPPKIAGKNFEEMTLAELQYAPMGLATQTHWARFVVVILPSDRGTGNERVYEFKAAKRGERIGWPNYHTYWKWSHNEPDSDEKNLLWLPADVNDVFNITPRIDITPETVLHFFPFGKNRAISIELARIEVNKDRTHGEIIGGDNFRRNFVNVLVERGKLKFYEKFRSGTNPKKLYYRPASK